MKRFLKFFVFSIFGFSVLPPTSFASGYAIFRSPQGTGTCIIRDDTASYGGYPDKLATKPDKPSACAAAKALKTENPGEAGKCSTYTDDTVALCVANGVTLSQ
jgi:hypothetical protein